MCWLLRLPILVAIGLAIGLTIAGIIGALPTPAVYIIAAIAIVVELALILRRRRRSRPRAR